MESRYVRVVRARVSSVGVVRARVSSVGVVTTTPPEDTLDTTPAEDILTVDITITSLHDDNGEIISLGL